MGTYSTSSLPKEIFFLSSFSAWVASVCFTDFSEFATSLGHLLHANTHAAWWQNPSSFDQKALSLDLLFITWIETCIILEHEKTYDITLAGWELWQRKAEEVAAIRRCPTQQSTWTLQNSPSHSALFGCCVSSQKATPKRSLSRNT